MNEPFVITRLANHARVAILQVRGRLDSSTADTLRARGAEVAAEGRNLILNLNRVTFMGSSGLGALLALAPETLPRAAEVALDLGALGFSVGLALITGVVFGLVPAVQVTRARSTCSGLF